MMMRIDTISSREIWVISATQTHVPIHPKIKISNFQFPCKNVAAAAVAAAAENSNAKIAPTDWMCLIERICQKSTNLIAVVVVVVVVVNCCALSLATVDTVDFTFNIGIYRYTAADAAATASHRTSISRKFSISSAKYGHMKMIRIASRMCPVGMARHAHSM